MPGVVYPRAVAASGSKTPTVPKRMKGSWLVSFQMRQITSESSAHYRSPVSALSSALPISARLEKAPDLAAGRDGKLSSPPTRCARAGSPEMKFAFHAERAFPYTLTFRRLFCSLTSCLSKYSSRYSRRARKKVERTVGLLGVTGSPGGQPSQR